MKEFNSGGSVNYIVITYEEDIHLVIDVLRAKPEFLLLLVMVVKWHIFDIAIGDTFIMKCYNVDIFNVKTEGDEAFS